MPELVSAEEMSCLVSDTGFEQLYLGDHTDQVQRSARRMHRSLWMITPVQPLIARLVPGADLYRKGTFAMLRAFSHQWRYGILVGEKPRR